MMEQKLSAEEFINILFDKDPFSKWLGIELDEIREGYSKLHFSIRKEMLNGFGTVHGGILFSAADTALAFACNSYGIVTVAVDVSISFALPVILGETLFIEAQQLHMGNRTGIFEVKTYNSENKLVSSFKATVYKTKMEIKA